MGIGALITHCNQIPAALGMIFQGAVSPKAITGGAVGSGYIALRIGASRGTFTNEAGMGTAAIAHGTSAVAHPIAQGLMGIVEVFLDTIVICTMTALVILTSGTVIHYGLDEGAVLTTRAFACTYGQWVSVPMAVFLSCFAFATMIGWGFYGLRCVQYIFGDGAWKPFVCLQAMISIASVLLETGTVWLFAELVNGLMAIPNLICLGVLSPVLMDLIASYKTRRAPQGALQ
jgi:AGCS family alanine or glycine:cation symporter